MGHAQKTGAIKNEAIALAMRTRRDLFKSSANYNKAHSELTREEQDAFAAGSHQKAAQAWKNGVFDDEVVPVSIPQRKGDPIVVSQDEGVRGDTTVESLSALRPAFSKDGTITAGSASQISDGAAAVLVLSAEAAAAAGATVLAEVSAR